MVYREGKVKMFLEKMKVGAISKVLGVSDPEEHKKIENARKLHRTERLSHKPKKPNNDNNNNDEIDSNAKLAITEYYSLAKTGNLVRSFIFFFHSPDLMIPSHCLVWSQSPVDCINFEYIAV